CYWPSASSRRPSPPAKTSSSSAPSARRALWSRPKRNAAACTTCRSARCGVERKPHLGVLPYLAERWRGGTLTTFRTIRARLNRLDELEKLWETGQIETYSKKMKSTLQREMDKIKANLSGIRKMERMPGLMFIIDPRREHIAVKEAKKLGVKTIALIDTDSDRVVIDLPRPGNDDARRAIELMLKEMSDAVIDGKTTRPETKTCE